VNVGVVSIYLNRRRRSSRRRRKRRSRLRL
jgi:hypothetical protein